jgi:hypothetical protein
MPSHLKGNVVKTTRNFITVLALAAIASTVSAQEKTRAQVNAEFAAAVRSGDVLTNGESGQTQRERRPDLYPSEPVVAKTRVQVEAERAAAERNGEMLTAGESGLREKDLHPALYPADSVVAGKTRAQVQAELAEAIRHGDVPGPGLSGQSAYRMYPWRYEKQRAMDAAAKQIQPSSPQASGDIAR